MDLLRLLWAPFAALGRAFGRYWLHGAPDGDGGAVRDGERGGVDSALVAAEPYVAVVIVAFVGAVLAAAALHA